MGIFCVILAIIGGALLYDGLGGWSYFWSSVLAFWFYKFMENERKSAEETRRAVVDRERKLSEEQQALACLTQDHQSLQQKIGELSKIANEASKKLQFAESEFRDRAFAPFWDAIEATVSTLGKYDKLLQDVESTARNLDSTARKLGSSVSSRNDVAALPDVVRPATELRTLVRQAQKDFEFAQIFEGRRTNAILGSLGSKFETLTSAIDGLGGSLEQIIRQIKSEKR